MFWVCLLEHRSVKRVQVTFTKDQWRIIERLKGIMGRDDAEVVRNIVLAWLSEKSFMVSEAKRREGAGGQV